VVVGALAVLAALEPDLSVAMMFFLLMSIVLFAGGVRIGHFIALGALAVPWCGARPSGCSTCCCAWWRSSTPAAGAPR
jgi:cell division protein FtsW